MRIRRIRIQNFRRFSDVTISDVPADTRLVVMTGPNGSGKSSLFDAFRDWQSRRWGRGLHWDEEYFRKKGLPTLDQSQLVEIDFHGDAPVDVNGFIKAFYIRSAYRNESDFTSAHLQRAGSLLDDPQVHRLIDNDSSVGRNYQRLISQSVEGIYSGDFDGETVKNLREKFIGGVRSSMNEVFKGLVLAGPGDPLQNGSFYFEKGVSKDFHYKNLSGGESRVRFAARHACQANRV